MPALIADLLAKRVRAAGGQPLITYYDQRSGERTELSAITFANWVAKTVNLMDDELALAPGDHLGLDLARTDPGHWVTAVWELACWSAGLVVDVTGAGSDRAAAMVCGPNWAAAEGSVASVVACSLHPLAIGLRQLPAEVLDYDTAVRSQPDSAPAPVATAAAPAWVDDERQVAQAELVELPGSGERRLVVPGDAWFTTSTGIVAALRGGGSVVLVVGAGSSAEIARIGAAERVASRC